MNASHLFSVIFFGLILLPSPAPAQSPATKPKDNAVSGDQSIAKSEASRLRNERRTQARSLLISLASDARIGAKRLAPTPPTPSRALC